MVDLPMQPNPSPASGHHGRRRRHDPLGQRQGAMMPGWLILMGVPLLIAAAPDPKGEQIYRQMCTLATGPPGKGRTIIIRVR